MQRMSESAIEWSASETSLTKMSLSKEEKTSYLMITSQVYRSYTKQHRAL